MLLLEHLSGIAMTEKCYIAASTALLDFRVINESSGTSEFLQKLFSKVFIIPSIFFLIIGLLHGLLP